MKKIKELRQYNSRTADPLIEPSNWYLRAITRFDDKENIVEEIIYENENTLESKTEYRYDDQQRLIEKVVYLSENEVGEKFSYTYNENNQLATETQHYADGSQTVRIFNYSDSRITITINDEEGSLEGQEIKLLQNGKITEEITLDEDKNETSHLYYTFNDAGLVESRIEKNAAGEVESLRKYFYNERNEMIELTELTGDGELISRRTFEYDEFNRLVQENIDGYSVNYTYNENGKRSREEIINPMQIIESFTDYEYEGDKVIRTVSCNKGNLMGHDSSGKSIRSAYLISKFEYYYYPDSE